MPKVKVTQNHIDTAIPQDSGHCMIVDAIKDSIKGARDITVDLQSIRYSIIDNNGDRWRLILFTPPIAQEGLVKFDDGVPLEPFTFGLPRPAQKIQTGKKNKETGKTERVKTQPKKLKTNSPNVPGRRAPTVEGGKPPPQASLSNKQNRRTGRMRRFGLKSMGRVKPEGENE